ncbi:MAG: PP2C family protein-serine/threonine phosphatase [Wujia sp.]
MTDVAMLTKHGGRDHNEDYILKVKYKEQQCFILCDGLGGHACGEVASELVANTVGEKFKQQGYYPAFLRDAFELAQTVLLEEQKKRHLENAMKTTLVVLVITEEQLQWGHIGDSRLYRIYANGEKYQRTRDHSLVQILCDTGEIKEEEIRTHEERNKLLRAMGAQWGNKTYDISPVLERGESQAFLLMTDGFWEYVYESEMQKTLRDTKTAQAWLDAMEQYVLTRADMTRTDNYSAIAVRVTE